MPPPPAPPPGFFESAPYQTVSGGAHMLAGGAYNLTVSTMWLARVVKDEVLTEAEGAPIVAALTLLGLAVLGLRLWWWCQQALLTRHKYARAHVADEDVGVNNAKYRPSPTEAERRLVLHACNESFDDRFDDDDPFFDDQFDDQFDDSYYDSYCDGRQPRLMAITEAPPEPMMARAMTDEELARIRGYSMGLGAEYDGRSRCSAATKSTRVVDLDDQDWEDIEDERGNRHRARVQDRRSFCPAPAPAPLAPQAREETERTLRSALHSLNEDASGAMVQHSSAPETAPVLPGRSGLYAPRVPREDRGSMSEAMFSSHG